MAEPPFFQERKRTKQEERAESRLTHFTPFPLGFSFLFLCFLNSPPLLFPFLSLFLIFSFCCRRSQQPPQQSQ